MFEIPMYNTVGTHDGGHVYVDFDNVYVPQQILDHYHIVQFMENFLNTDVTVEAKIINMIVEFWHKELKQLEQGILNSEHSRLFTRLIKKGIPPCVLESFDDYQRYVDHPYAYIQIKSTKHDQLDIEIYAEWNGQSYVHVTKNSKKQHIRNLINEDVEPWTVEEIQRCRSFEHVLINQTGIKGLGILDISDTDITFSTGIAAVPYMTSQGLTFRYVWILPIIDPTKSRIHFSPLVLTNINECKTVAYGAKVMKGKWVRTQDRHNVVQYDKSEYFNKLYRHCIGKEKYWVFDLFYDIERIEENLFEIKNKVDNDILAFRFNGNKDVVVLAAVINHIFLAAMNYKDDPMVRRYKLFKSLT